jgi:hypothetical protein
MENVCMSAGALWTMAALALATAGCGAQVSPGSSPANGSEWSTHRDQARGYEVGVPSGWQRASGSLTPNITSPREILTLATVRLHGASPDNYCRPWDEAQLPEFSERDALVTIQEGGRGSLTLNYKSYAARPEHFRPEHFRGGSTFTRCFVRDLPVSDHWFGFSDAGRAFHVLVIVGRSAPERVRRQAWEILDSLRFDPDAEPAWQAGP